MGGKEQMDPQCTHPLLLVWFLPCRADSTAAEKLIIKVVRGHVSPAYHRLHPP